MNLDTRQKMNKITKRLLMVDDEKNVLQSLKRLLSDTDYEVLIANSAEEAIRIFENNEIQLVISDYRMPGMNGVDFLRSIRRAAPDTIRIILSGYADAAVMVEAINDGQIYKFIPKPWNEHDLLTTISTAFEKYYLQRENTELYSELSMKYVELQELTRTLEDKVNERTRDLETKNRALNVAQTILNYLPTGVIGIDSSGTVVYMNKALEHFVDISRLQLGSTVDSAFNPDIVEIFERVMDSERIASNEIGPNIRMICKPLPDGIGVVCVYLETCESNINRERNISESFRKVGSNE